MEISRLQALDCFMVMVHCWNMGKSGVFNKRICREFSTSAVMHGCLGDCFGK